MTEGPEPDLLALRDEFYRLMIRSLGEPENLRGFGRRLKGRSPRSRRFLRDKLPRYQAALKAWFSQRPPSDPLRRDLALAEVLFNHGLYFDTHEYLEGPWRRSRGSRRACLQGLIQIAAGLHKLELSPGSQAGALELVSKGLGNLRASEEMLGPGGIAEIGRRLEPVLEALRRGCLRLSEVPRLSWADY